MLSSNNILSPASGRPITAPTQDMVLGLYAVTTELPGGLGEGRIFSTMSEAIMAKDNGELDVRSMIKIRLHDGAPTEGEEPEGWTMGTPWLQETTLGRAFFNETLPADYPYVNTQVSKKELSAIVDRLAERYPKAQVAASLDALKAAGFHWATRSGVTIAIDDVVTPASKPKILDRYEKEAEKIEGEYQDGLRTLEERRSDLVEVWTRATAEIAKAMEDNFPPTNPIAMMVNSGARGNMLQLRQIAGIRGLVSNPKGEIIPRPIKSNFREGLSVLEYFIST